MLITNVELLFCENVFSESSIRVTSKTAIEKRNTGEWTDLGALKNYNS